jgi:hypothetical protein
MVLVLWRATVSIDTSQAEALPGVRDFYNLPMGVVMVADNEEICDRALRLIKIT